MSDNRFAAIDGILTSPKKTTPRLKSVTPAEPPNEPGTDDVPPRPANKKPAATKPVSATTGGTRRVVFRLAAELHQALTTRVETDRTSQSHVVLDAIEQTHTNETLGALIADAQSQETGEGLFPRTKLRGRAEPTIPVEIRINAGALDLIDQLVTDHQAANRTRLITTALRGYLL